MKVATMEKGIRTDMMSIAVICRSSQSIRLLKMYNGFKYNLILAYFKIADPHHRNLKHGEYVAVRVSPAYP